MSLDQLPGPLALEAQGRTIYNYEPIVKDKVAHYRPRVDLSSEIPGRTIYNYKSFYIGSDGTQKRRLKLPSSLSKLNIDLSRLWLTRPARESSRVGQIGAPTAVVPEQNNAEAEPLQETPTEEPPRARTPVFTRPPPGLVLKPSDLPSPGFTFNKTPYLLPCAADAQAAKERERLRVWDDVLKPIRVPELLPLKLKLSLPTFDWDNQPSTVFSPLKDALRLKDQRAGRRTRDPLPLLPSSRSSSPCFSGDDEDDDDMVTFTSFADLEASESSEGEEEEDTSIRRQYAFDEEFPEDEAYFGDHEDNKWDHCLLWRRASSDQPLVTDDDCFSWLEDELIYLFT